jgi:hypothetical protein
MRNRNKPLKIGRWLETMKRFYHENPFHGEGMDWVGNDSEEDNDRPLTHLNNLIEYSNKENEHSILSFINVHSTEPKVFGLERKPLLLPHEKKDVPSFEKLVNLKSQSSNYVFFTENQRVCLIPIPSSKKFFFCKNHSKWRVALALCARRDVIIVGRDLGELFVGLRTFLTRSSIKCWNSRRGLALEMYQNS